MAIVRYSPVEGEMKVDDNGHFVSLESYLLLAELAETLKEEIEILERFGTQIQNERKGKLCKDE